MEILFIIWPFILLIGFIIYGASRYIKDKKTTALLFSKIEELNGGVLKEVSVKSFFPKFSVVFGYAEVNGNLDFVCSFNKDSYAVFITYVDRYVGWPVTSTVIIFESSDFFKKNIVISNEDLSGFNRYVRGLQERGASIHVWGSTEKLTDPITIKYGNFLKNIFDLNNNIKIDFYNGRMTIVVGRLLKSNRLDTEQIFLIINRFFDSLDLSK